ncbi:MAG: NADH-ubiquinone oxidoreductase-F iron-sulfur binding region domain-containing protein [Candidatus Polarisedimenticolia bacterium]
MTAILLTPLPEGERTESLHAYRATGGWDAWRRAVAGDLTPGALRRMVGESGLLGRGGAAFPAARKWDLAAAAPGTPRYVVANGGEHEPGSSKDRVLLTRHPHKVLEGMALCGHATGAAHGYLYLIEDMTDALEAATRAVDEARSARLLGERFDVTLVKAPPTYVAGEETAALEVIEGRRPWPRKKPPFPGEHGLFGQPTTVNNVETLACVPSLAREGAAWFRALGRRGGTGTMLFTLDARLSHPGVHELPVGSTFRELLYDAGGGAASGRDVRAILPAMSSCFLPASCLDTPMTAQDVRAAGSGLGCGGVTVLEDGECVVERVAAIAEFFKREQCGQCPACRMETSTLAAIVSQVRDGAAGGYADQIERVVAFAAGKGYCSLIPMAAAPVVSALKLFPGDFAHHAAQGACPFPP